LAKRGGDFLLDKTIEIVATVSFTVVFVVIPVSCLTNFAAVFGRLALTATEQTLLYLSAGIAGW
jgi:hypothetical protein